jgi:hypothetical protein
MRSLIKLGLIIAAFAVSQVNANSMEGDSHFAAVSAPTCSQVMTDSLFEHKASYATLTPNPNKKAEYQLKLRGLRNHVIYFSEQPFQMGRMDTDEFYKLWVAGNGKEKQLKFKASIEGLVWDAKQGLHSVSYKLRLSQPNFHAGSVSYQATLLPKNKSADLTKLRDVSLLVIVPACAQCNHYPCLSC